MDIAKLTSKGQVTIPKDVRLKLGIREGDKILFVEKGGEIYIRNASMAALRTTQNEFAGVAEKAGLYSEEDVVAMLKKFRKERSEKQHENHAGYQCTCI